MAADFKFFNEEIKQPAATNKSISNLEVFDFKLNWKKKKEQLPNLLEIQDLKSQELWLPKFFSSEFRFSEI